MKFAIPHFRRQLIVDLRQLFAILDVGAGLNEGWILCFEAVCLRHVGSVNVVILSCSSSQVCRPFLINEVGIRPAAEWYRCCSLRSTNDFEVLPKRLEFLSNLASLLFGAYFCRFPPCLSQKTRFSPRQKTCILHRCSFHQESQQSHRASSCCCSRPINCSNRLWELSLDLLMFLMRLVSTHLAGRLLELWMRGLPISQRGCCCRLATALELAETFRQSHQV